MRLKTLTLENFQGIRNLTVEFAGNSTSIYGRNGIGKTTIANAWSWLLFGRANTDIKNFSPKTKDKDGDIHHLNNSVTADIDTGDSLPVSLRKEHYEKWTKRRGEDTEQFTGEGDNYYINDLPVKQKEYDEYVRKITGGSDIAPLLTNLDSFANLRWDARRKILFAICNPASDSEIIAGNPEFEPLQRFLSGPNATLEDVIKAQKSQATRQNKELELIPARMSEAMQAMPDLNGVKSLTQLQKEREELTQRIDALRHEIDDLKNADPSANIARQINALKLEYQDRLNIVKAGISEKLNKATANLRQIEKETDAVFFRKEDAEAELKTAEANLEEMTKGSASLKKQLKEVQSEVFDESATVCPTCGQTLPEDRIEELRQKFNLSKSQQIESILAFGKENYSALKFKEARQEIETLKQKIKACEDMIPEHQMKADAAKAEIEAIKKSYDSPKDSRLEQISGRIDKLESARLSGDNASLRLQIEGRENLIRENTAKLDEVENSIHSYQYRDQQEKRLAELEEQKKKASQAYAETMKTVELAERMVKLKCAMVTSTVNEHFKSIQFKLFDTQINGGIRECCDIMIPAESGALVPYAFANTAARYNAGLEIISTLSKHYGYSLPVFIDNAESVTHLTPVDSQVIKLIVSPGDDVLRVEQE